MRGGHNNKGKTKIYMCDIGEWCLRGTQKRSRAFLFAFGVEANKDIFK